MIFEGSDFYKNKPCCYIYKYISHATVSITVQCMYV